jgi:sensor histidine kinase regulating citrate/malate metabolism
MLEMIEEKQIEKCRDYLVQITGEIRKKEILPWTNHKILDMIFNMKFQEARKEGIGIKCLSDDLSGLELTVAEICSFFTNLLDNAIEAEKQSAEREGIWFRMKMAREGCHIIIQLENSYNETEENDKIRTVGTERVGAKRGIGLRSVRKIVRQYGGMIEDRKEDGRFRIKILLPVRSGWNS